jgi:hypothetical protein
VNAIGIMTRAAIAFLYTGFPPGSDAEPPEHNLDEGGSEI